MTGRAIRASGCPANETNTLANGCDVLMDEHFFQLQTAKESMPMSPITAGTVVHYRWDDVPAEKLKGSLTRKLITGDRMMIAHVYFKKGDDVPLHSHENEQLTYVLSGALQFWFGAQGEQEITVRAGEVIVIPSNLPHRALALEDTLDVDVFCPPRQDWLDGTDAYLRG
jgi:quercetin dioxygenase-like cupin family protein